MARIELTNVTAGGGGGSTTLGLTTTGTSGASLLSAVPGGYILNIPVYQGALTLTTTGSGAATLSGNILNIPTPTGSSAAGSTGEVQYNGGSGAFAASPNLFWAAGTNRLGIGTSSPNQTLEVSGAMRLTGTAGTADFMLGRSSAGDVSTVTLGTTGTSGAATLSANVLNIPQYQGSVSLTTSGTSGASTFAANVLNIPQYQGALTLTTTGTSGAATLVGNTLNIPQYSGGGGGTPAGNAGEVQFNSTPAGSFAASANLSWNDTATQLNIGAPSSPTGKLNVKGGGTTSATVNLRLTDSGNTELLKVLDNGSTNIGTGFNWDNTNNRLGINTSSPANDLDIIGSLRLGDATVKFSALVSTSAINVGTTTAHQLRFITNNSVRGIIDTSGNMAIGSPSAAGRFLIVGSNTSSGTNALLVRNARTPTPDDIYKIENDGKISYLATNTAAGTTGPQTINRPSGTVNFGIGASSLVVTNSLCTTASIVLPVIRTNDATAQIKNVVPTAGSFTINLSAAATAETSVGFFIIN